MENSFTEIQTSRIQLLIDALKSDKYAQGTGVLNRNNEGYCCLAIACEVAIESGLNVEKKFVCDLTPEQLIEQDAEEVDKNSIAYDKYVYYLPPSVQEWFGFADNQGQFVNSPVRKVFVSGENGGAYQHLAAMNDKLESFEYIASVIKKYWIDPWTSKEAA